MDILPEWTFEISHDTRSNSWANVEKWSKLSGLQNIGSDRAEYRKSFNYKARRIVRVYQVM
jgi:hypothetical protein